MKPPLTYYGGKQQLSKLIVSLIPKHTLYCEPFFGGGAIFFAKEPSQVEVINDTNGEVVNFYRVLRVNFAELTEQVKATLHSRHQHNRALVIYKHPDLFTDVHRAWAVWVLAHQGFSSKLNGTWGYDRTENKTTKQVHNKKSSFTENFAKRLEQAQIECADALKVIQTRDSEDSFFYCDPPYFNSHKGHYKNYNVDDFEKLLMLLSCIKGKFLLSSYPSPLLEKYIKRNKWFAKTVSMPFSVGTTKTKGIKREVLTANYPL